MYIPQPCLEMGTTEDTQRRLPAALNGVDNVDQQRHDVPECGRGMGVVAHLRRPSDQAPSR